MSLGEETKGRIASVVKVNGAKGSFDYETKDIGEVLNGSSFHWKLGFALYCLPTHKERALPCH